jgi:exodeoxyribonuclease V alpha subunit
MAAISPQNFNRLDKALGQFFAQRADLPESQRAQLAKLIARLNFELGNGHSCITVDTEEQQLLQASKLVSTAQLTPMILEHDRLYFYRYWAYEKRLAEQVIRLTKQTKVWFDLESLLARYFPQLSSEMDWQCEAVEKAVGQSFSIITGGPGTGKTTTIVKLLALLQEISDTKLEIRDAKK